MRSPVLQALLALALISDAAVAGTPAAPAAGSHIAADAPAPAGLQLPPACALISSRAVATTSAPRSGFAAKSFRATLPGRAGAVDTSLGASTLDVSASGTSTVPAQLEQAASAAAAATLIALTGRHQAGCPNSTLQEIARPIVEGLQHGESFDANWRGLTVSGASGHVSASLMHLALRPAPASGSVQISLSVNEIHGALKSPALLPDRLQVEASLPADRLPDLLAAMGGSGTADAIPLTVDRLLLVSGATAITGSGTATGAGSLPASSAHLQLDATEFGALVTRAAALDLARLHTGLFLCQLVGRRKGAALHWDVTLDHGVLAVNNLPLPVF